MYEGPRKSTTASNLKSCQLNPDLVRQKLLKEVLLGRMAGPFKHPPFTNLRISPIGLVPKKDSHEFRLIHHLSFPQGSSVNDFIGDEHASVNYTKFDDAVFMLQQIGRGGLIAKADIKSAFRLIPVRHADFDLLGICFENQYYIDMCLPFGCRTSCALFEKFSTFLEWYTRENLQLLQAYLLHYLDDFLFGGPRGTNTCHIALETFISVCAELGVPVAEDKTVQPTTKLIFLGIELDTVQQQSRIPQDKISKCLQVIDDFLSRKKVQLKEAQSLIGLLNFICRVIPMGRPFIRRLIDSTKGVTKASHRLRVNSTVKKDLVTWKSFLKHHNGITLFMNMLWQDSDMLQLYTDSAGGKSQGFGLYYNGRWAHGRWPPDWHSKGYTTDITFLEFFPVLLSVLIWGESLRNHKVIFNSDNQAVVSILNKLSSTSPRVMTLVRWFTLQCMQLNLFIKGRYIPGKLNIIADCLSRSKFQQFHRLAPTADRYPTKIPGWIWRHLKQKLTDC